MSEPSLSLTSDPPACSQVHIHFLHKHVVQLFKCAHPAIRRNHFWTLSKRSKSFLRKLVRSELLNPWRPIFSWRIWSCSANDILCSLITEKFLLDSRIIIKSIFVPGRYQKSTYGMSQNDWVNLKSQALTNNMTTSFHWWKYVWIL